MNEKVTPEQQMLKEPKDKSASQSPKLVFTMGDGHRRFEVWDGSDHLRIVIQQNAEPHEWFYLDRAEVVKLVQFCADWSRTIGSDATPTSNQLGIYTDLMKLAAEMARGDGMPDWSEHQFCRSTPTSERSAILQALRDADEIVVTYALRLRAIVDRLAAEIRSGRETRLPQDDCATLRAMAATLRQIIERDEQRGHTSGLENARREIEWSARLERSAVKAKSPQPDTERLDWLQEELVDTIYMDDGRLIDVGGQHQGSLRKAIDARRTVKAEPQCSGLCQGHSSEASLSGWMPDANCPVHGIKATLGQNGSLPQQENNSGS